MFVSKRSSILEFMTFSFQIIQSLQIPLKLSHFENYYFITSMMISDGETTTTCRSQHICNFEAQPFHFKLFIVSKFSSKLYLKFEIFKRLQMEKQFSQSCRNDQNCLPKIVFEVLIFSNSKYSNMEKLPISKLQYSIRCKICSLFFFIVHLMP